MPNTRPTFAESDRLKALALRSVDPAGKADLIALLDGWWQASTGKPTDERPFAKQPPGALLLRFYRQAAEQLKQLKEKAGKDFADLQEMDRLAKMLAPAEEDSFVKRLEDAWQGTLTTSGDAIWDSWVANVRSGHIPDSWFGPLLNGVKG